MCFVDGLHHVAGEARTQFSHISTLISSVKKVFLKALSRLATFRSKFDIQRTVHLDIFL
jgi:hypothetical protein